MSDGNHSGKSGEDLYRCFLEGDETAFEEMVGLYRKSLTRYIYTFVNDTREAEELMIDAFAALSVDTRYSGKSSLKTYLFAIGRNTTLHHIRKYKRVDNISIESIVEDTYDMENLPELDFIKKEERSRLRAAMDRLKIEYREVLHLIYFENMNYADAGASMNKSVKQVEYLMRAAKASLKNILESEGMG